VSRGLLTWAFRVRAPFAGHAELTPWLLSPRRCLSRASGRSGSRTGRSPAAPAAPEASLTRVLASR
jgi:hypothetical protein